MCVLLIDDELFCRSVLDDLISTRLPEVSTLAAGSVAEALDKLEGVTPTLVLADFSSADVFGRPGIEEIVAKARPGPVLTLDRRMAPAHARRARAAGARGYVPKTSSRELIGAAVELVVAGGEYYPDLGRDPEPHRHGWTERLTPRQREILRLLAQGRTNGEIANELGVALPTVKLHVRGVLQAAQARNRTEAVVKARAELV